MLYNNIILEYFQIDYYNTNIFKTTFYLYFVAPNADNVEGKTYKGKTNIHFYS